ncbi:gag-pol polyprotein [Cucumis melo var. makuwa]|uniref:Gag-pol polyprotein n=1 Tax=Cucumis melo var. makuwa TaxID=1194695 RepID=A0A5D3BCH6_CUCMM|nr:gag-pol polyprotein [Cucumis melo var. makuwa]TYJ95988.1 gag-pol polyprotein [Cucumis melo var. makuwa]
MDFGYGVGKEYVQIFFSRIPHVCPFYNCGYNCYISLELFILQLVSEWVVIRSLIDGIREGNSTTRPPLLDGGNYGYWKSRTEAFLMSLDMRCWRAIISGWEHPTKKDETCKITQKYELKWTSEEDDAAIGNSRALNTLFNVIDPNIFKLINTCKLAKVAWDTLEVAFEATSKVKISRLQILTSRFKALQMTKEETIAEFNVRVLDITNESNALEEKIFDSKLVGKVLRSLPSKFNMKVTAIEEANDL